MVRCRVLILDSCFLYGNVGIWSFSFLNVELMLSIFCCFWKFVVFFGGFFKFLFLKGSNFRFFGFLNMLFCGFFCI